MTSRQALRAGRAPMRARRALAALTLVGLTLVHGADAHAQAVRLGGRVVDTAGVAVPGLDLVLHRVDDAGGAQLAEARSDSLGRFVLETNEAGADGAVYFAATRLGGQLYIGPFVRPPLPADGYTIVVGGEPVDLGGLSTLPTARGPTQVRPPASPRRWWLAVLPALGLVAVALYFAMRAQGPSARRLTLIRIAQLDVLAQEQGTQVGPERAQLVEQLLGGED